jgi:hypothetical protein
MGLKSGTRDRLIRHIVDIDLEPYPAPGIRPAGSRPDEIGTDHFKFTLYLGARLDIFRKARLP